MTSVGVVTPFWLDRPPAEALDIAVAADEAGFGTLWIGEMATFDAFAVAVAVGARTSGISLRVGPLAVGVRSPVALALGLSTVVAATGRPASLALGASSPRIVSQWHGRPFEPVRRMRSTVRDTRALLNGHRVHGFRLPQPVPGTSIAVAAFGPAMMRVAAAVGDEVVLNLVSAEHVASVRRSLASLVARARAGESRASLATGIPLSLLESVGAIGSASDISGRVAEYFAAGASHVGLVPVTASDPAGRHLLTTLSPLLAEGAS